MHVRTWFEDLRLTERHAGRARAFYTSAVLTLAVGMAGATVMFTFIRGILLRPFVPAGVKGIVVFLASNASSSMTGVTLASTAAGRRNKSRT